MSQRPLKHISGTICLRCFLLSFVLALQFSVTLAFPQFNLCLLSSSTSLCSAKVFSPQTDFWEVPLGSKPGDC